MRENQLSVFSKIELSEKGEVPKRVQVLRVGAFKHPTHGLLDITQTVLAEMKSNFDANVRGIDTAFDYYHDSDQDASAWVQSLELSEDKKELWANVEWTPKAAQKLADRELRYFSPDFVRSWKDPESGKTHKNVLFGGGLTNRPFIKEMQPIVADEKNMKEGNMKTVAELEAELKVANEQIVKLTEEAKIQLAEGGKAAELKAKIAELQKQLAALEGDNKMLSEAKAKADGEAAAAKKESEFNVLLTEGKACAAQKEAFLKGDMSAFIKLAQAVNLKAGGSSTSTTSNISEDEDEQDAVIKLAEELVKADASLTHGESLSLAVRKIKEAKK